MLATIAPGCGGGGAGDGTVTVYVSVPLHGVRGVEGRAIAEGARLALEQAGASAGELEVRALYLDDTGNGAEWSPVRTAANARRAAEDSSAIGYVGELDSGATRISLPITNQAGMVQISPGATAVDLTRETSAASPETYRPTGDRSFARIVPDDEAQARAAAVLAERLDVRRAGALFDQSSFGEILLDEFTDAARQQGISIGPTAGLRGGSDEMIVSAFSQTPPDVIYFAGSEGAALDALTDIARRTRGTPIIASDALQAASLEVCRRLRAPLYLTSPYAQPGDRFDDQPAVAYGYEAMSLLLDAIRRRGADRGAVIDQVLATEDRVSPIGRYSIDGRGDTTLDRIAVYTVRDCQQRFDRELRAPG